MNAKERKELLSKAQEVMAKKAQKSKFNSYVEFLKAEELSCFKDGIIEGAEILGHVNGKALFGFYIDKKKTDARKISVFANIVRTIPAHTLSDPQARFNLVCRLHITSEKYASPIVVCDYVELAS